MDTLGKVIKVNGTKVVCKLFELWPQYILKNGELIRTPRINSLIGTNIGKDTIICKIVGEYQENNSNYLNASVIGIYSSETKIFNTGIRELPFVNANIFLLNNIILNSIFNINDYFFTIGKDIFNPKNDVYIPFNNFFASHIGIFGNTGSGKSWTLSKIKYEFNKIIHDKKINNIYTIHFDFTGEFSSKEMNTMQEKIINLGKCGDDNKILINFNNLNVDFWSKILNPSETTQLPLLYKSHKDFLKNYNDFLKDGIDRIIVEIQNFAYMILKTFNRDIFYSFRNLFNEIIPTFFEEINIKMDYGNIIIEQNGKLIKIDEKLKENIEKYIKSDSKIVSEYFNNDYFSFFKLFLLKHIVIGNFEGAKQHYVFPLLYKFDKVADQLNKYFHHNSKLQNFIETFTTKNTIIDFTNVDDFKSIICYIMGELIFNDFKSNKYSNSKIENFISIIIDECHSIFSNDNDNFFYTSIYKKIAKEGRKYNIFLWIASQRPSEINQTIISQLHNTIIHRLVNQNDISLITNAMPFLDSDSISMISNLGNGESVISGTAFKNIVFSKIDCSEIYTNNITPKTNNFVFFKGKKYEK